MQIDGSYHPWLGDEGPHFTLLLAVDDATGTVANAVFRPEDDTRGYFILMEELIQRWGIPLALYGDRHGVFKFSGKPPPHPAAGGSHPLQPGHGGTGHTADLRPLCPACQRRITSPISIDGETGGLAHLITDFSK